MRLSEISWMTLQWRHCGRDGVSNHQPSNCLFSRLIRRRTKKHQSSASLAFVQGIHRWPVNSPHKWTVSWNMFQFDDVIMRKPFIGYFIDLLLLAIGMTDAISLMYISPLRYCSLFYFIFTSRVAFKLTLGLCASISHRHDPYYF